MSGVRYLQEDMNFLKSMEIHYDFVKIDVVVDEFRAEATLGSNYISRIDRNSISHWKNWEPHNGTKNLLQTIGSKTKYNNNTENELEVNCTAK